jgi:hypothetical protein
MHSSAHNGESKEEDYGERGEEEQEKEKKSGDNNYNNESSLLKIYLSIDKGWFVIVIVVVD